MLVQPTDQPNPNGGAHPNEHAPKEEPGTLLVSDAVKPEASGEEHDGGGASFGDALYSPSPSSATDNLSPQYFWDVASASRREPVTDCV